MLRDPESRFAQGPTGIKTRQLYVDGVPTQPVSPQSASASEPCRLLLGRLKPLPRLPGRVHSRPFVGLIDELALYNRPLTAAEVRHHYELGTTVERMP